LGGFPKLIFHISGALAEFERDIVRERTQQAWRLPGRGAGKVAGRSSPALRGKSLSPGSSTKSGKLD
jgi:DNA invertase Pin-like site-specific DNA recombinase